jgi:catechol 2,3-dioxygenase-like lactoylglutathione lyase family enzyme
MAASAADLTETQVGSQEVLGIVQVTIPVSGLARSATWYRDLLNLSYVRELGNDHGVTGCALADWQARYLIALRRRSDTAGVADLRGEHPVVLEATDAKSAERLRDRATARGISSTSGTHADGSWIEFIDPDGIAIRIVHSAVGPKRFLGIHFTEDSATFYDTPRLGISE